MKRMPTSNVPGSYFLYHFEVLGPAVLLFVAGFQQADLLQ